MQAWGDKSREGVSMMKSRRLVGMRAVTAALLVAATLGAGARAEAGPVQLGFILDGSGSIGSDNWNTIRTGLATAVNTYIPLGGLYEVSVVTFGPTAATNISNFLVTDDTSRTNLSSTIAALPYLNGTSTNYQAAFVAMQNVLANTIANATWSYVNFATDGQNNTVSDDLAVAARNNLIGSGVDNLSIEAIGPNLDLAFLQDKICHPGPCDTTVPYNFPAQGFLLQVPDAAGYAAAIGEKIEVVTTVPDVGSTIFLLAAGLAGLAGAGRRLRRKA
jgi:hypothetical protein